MRIGEHKIEALIKRLVETDRRAIARAISIVENLRPEAQILLRSVYFKTGHAYRVGITGPPGAGKSTIASKLARLYGEQGLKVGIIAVDPTSPFTGGALLGDRIRMSDVELDDRVFIRSMASRGSLGGLSQTTQDVADVLDAAGFDMILLETVGVGQSELDIVQAADTVIVVLVPESGDAIQAMKAGLMEIADFFVLNKADRPGADQAVIALRTILALRPATDGWTPAVLRAIASEAKGIEEISQLIAQHREFQSSNNLLLKRRTARVQEKVKELVRQAIQRDFWNEERRKLLESKLPLLLNHVVTPFDLAEELLANFKNGSSWV